MTVEASARCGAHPSEPAAAVCARCGAFICAGCVREERAAPHCPECFDRLKRADAPSESRQALVLAVIGLGIWPVAAVGMVLALRTLRRARAGLLRAEDERLANMAVRLAAAGLVWPLFALGLHLFA